MSSLLNKLSEKAVPGKILLQDGQQALNFFQLEKAVNHFSRILNKLDITRLALYADNSVDWVITDLACQKLGICLLPLPSYFSSEQLEHALRSCGIQHILTDRPQHLCERLSEFRLEKSYDYSSSLCFLQSEDIKAPAKLPLGTQKITFTSGSTGKPKGVCLSLEQQYRQAEALAEVIDLQDPLHLCVLPLPTLLENIAGVYAPLLAGGSVHIAGLPELGYEGSRLANPQAFLQTISRNKPDTLIMIPQLLMLLVQASQQGWQAPPFSFVAVGGSKVSPELLIQARKLGIPAYEGYGLSECASVVSLNTPEADNPGSCGRVLPHLELTIEEDEVIISGNCMLGYVGDSEHWYPARISSGDLGYLDDTGYLHINGRRKNVLISSYGRNISPEWVESELLASPLLGEAVVFGDARPFCIALVHPRNKDLSRQQLQQVIDQVNAHLPDYAQVKSWLRLTSPLAMNPAFMTSNGRPRRNKIERHFAEDIDALYQREDPQVSTQTRMENNPA